MLSVLVGLLGAIGVAAWGTALYSLIQIVALAPAGQRFGTLFTLGWWKFDKIRATVGPAAEPHIKRYVMAFGAFFVVVIGMAVVSIFLAADAQNGTVAAG